MQSRIETVTIIGVGLIGGSFALALRQAGFSGRVLGVSSTRTLEQAIRLGVIDEAVSFEEGASRGDLLYLAQPISIILKQIPLLAGHLKPGALVTDVGSTKVEIVQTALQHLPAGSFLGGHPMAGKESRGVESADANLFRGRTYILTPVGGDASAAQLEFIQWVERIGSRVLTIDSAQHDSVIAYTSHLAQMASTALGVTVGVGVGTPEMLQTAGPGFHDMTRLAMSSYGVWGDIIHTNRSHIATAIDSYIAVLERLRDSLGSPEAERLFERGAAAAKVPRGLSTFY